MCETHIPDGVKELCGGCFARCRSLSRVAFGETSSLKQVDASAFSVSVLGKVHISSGCLAMPHHARMTLGIGMPKRRSPHIPLFLSCYNLTCLGQLDPIWNLNEKFTIQM